MKILTKNVVFSILKVGIVTALLATFMLLGVDLFKNLDRYTDYRLTLGTIFRLTILYGPEAFLLALGPSFLFSVTYYLSMLHANNEIISIMNAGIRYRKIIVPCIITSIFIGAFYFGFNENFAIQCSNRKENMMQSVSYSEKNTANNSNIALSDTENGYMVYAKKYVEKDKTLLNLSFIEKKDDNNVRRTDVSKATWSEEGKYWEFENCNVYEPSADGKTVEITHKDFISDSGMVLEPELFRNMSSQVAKMDLRVAMDYLQKIRKLNPDQYAQMGTDFYERLFSCLTPIVMIVIACSMNYRFKKNILFFSIISSLCVAVVYFVVQMITMMLSNQGVIPPYLGVLLPFGIILVLAAAAALIMRE